MTGLVFGGMPGGQSIDKESRVVYTQSMYIRVEICLLVLGSFFLNIAAIQPTNQTEIKFTIQQCRQFIGDEVEPRIRRTDLHELQSQMAFDEELQDHIVYLWNQYDETCNTCIQNAAEKIWETSAQYMVSLESSSTEYLTNEFKRNNIQKNYALRTKLQRKLQSLLEAFIQSMNEILPLTETELLNLGQSVRRLPLLRWGIDDRWKDLGTFPDLMHEYNMFARDNRIDEIELPSDSTAPQVIQALLEEWESQINPLVPRYLKGRLKSGRERALAWVSTDNEDWLRWFRGSRRLTQQIYKLTWRITEQIYEQLNIIAGKQIASRWLRKMECFIFPESCPLNTYEIIQTEIPVSAVDDIPEICLYEDKLFRLRSQMRVVAWWFYKNLPPKLEGHEVPPIPVELEELDKRYTATIDSLHELVVKKLELEGDNSYSSQVEQLRAEKP